MSHHKLIIVGSGPAGYTASLYASRANLKPLCIAGYESGGQLMTTTDVENYPGFPEGIQGPALMKLFQKQAERFGTQVVFQDVTQVEFRKKQFEVWVEQEKHTAEAVIVATGAKPKLIGVKGEKTFFGKGVSTCATCDGAFFKDQVVCVIGGGDTAAEESLYLSRLASKVIVIHRREGFRASQIMVDRMKSNEKIEFKLNRISEEIYGDEKVTGIEVKDTTGQQDNEKIPCGGVFIAIGHTPTTALFDGQLKQKENGYLWVEPGTTKSNIPGVFIAGDVSDHVYRQAVTAAGMGCMAALEAERYLQELT
jgi:thioredoxin reductase (NADPH)